MPSDARSLNITKFLASYSRTHEPVGLKSSAHVKRVIRSLEEIEDEDSSGMMKGGVDRKNGSDMSGIVMLSGDYYERNSESMNFRLEEPSGEGDWEGGLIGESGDEEDDDVTDDIIQSQPHGVTAVKKTEMATAVDPRGIEKFDGESIDGIAIGLQQDLVGNKRTSELSLGESDEGEENTMGLSSASGTSDGEALLADEIEDQSSGSGSGLFNKTIMREVQRNLHKVWRYASPGKNLDMVSKGPIGKEEERKLQEIYNLVIKHESKASSSLHDRKRAPKEGMSGEASGFSDEHSDGSGDSGDKSNLGSAEDSGEKYEVVSGIGVKSGKDESQKLVVGGLSGESSGQIDDLDVSYESGSGSGAVNKKLMKEVEHNLHSVWRYAAPKKDLDMVAKGPKGKEEEQKLKKIYNIVREHETGSAFIDFELREKEKSLDNSDQAQKSHKHVHKSRKSKVKIVKVIHNSTEAKLYRFLKARKNRYNKNLKRLKPWGMGMGKHSSRHRHEGKYVKQVGGKGKPSRSKEDRLALLGEEMKELAPNGDKESKTKDKEDSNEKNDKDETKEISEKEPSKQQTEPEREINRNRNKSEEQRVVLDRQKPFDKTQLEVGRKIEELILNRMAELETKRLNRKVKGKKEHLKDSKEEAEEAGMEKEVPKGKY